MKIALTGKGGVGKTTISALLARRLVERNFNVLAIDADFDANFASALGIDITKEDIKPISEMEKLIEEKMGTSEDIGKGLYKLNPFVGDIPDKFSIKHKGVNFLAVGTVKKGGEGCYCAENKLIKRLINHIVLKSDETVVMDMEAGLEHISRGTAKGIDLFLIVVEPGLRSLQTANKIKEMAHDIGVKNIYAIVNKLHSKDELIYIRDYLKDIEIISSIYLNDSIAKADLKGISPADTADKELISKIDEIIDRCYS
ncbi:AAA family ATPase [Thermohalobacter berrensis]|uniref:Carbon monoxide dehydrogenase n=1 Tax=Thermohalobacter berrensis TaxID=99594 RepID=A0A419T0G8_9FIRM|nr:AAA family ATPase [Thermohalobacter berrensis]RKD30928.1 carbon monoxide dehydrogenase [Thermohalobacter berrensis]